jgi:hypothetical protein
MKQINELEAESAHSIQGFIKCDACPARAMYNVQFETGNLEFCRHHFLQSKNAIENISIAIIEYTN